VTTNSVPVPRHPLARSGSEVSVSALIIDDSPIARTIIRHHLTKLGCTIIGEAENAVQALQLFRENRPDVVTLDLMMPEVNGVDAIAAFHAIKTEAPHTSVIIASALPFQKTQDNFFREGAFDYIVKPFNRFSFERVRQRLIRKFPQLADHTSGA
jgi:two-component system, chemotaxis family, chemotaxis protein CheY